MILQHPTYGAQTPSYPHLLAEELERMALERRNHGLALRTQMHRPSAFPMPGPARLEETSQGLKIEPALDMKSENTDSEVSASVTPMPPVNSESVEEPVVSNVRSLRQSLEEAYDRSQMAQGAGPSADREGGRTDFEFEEFGHPDNHPEWKASPSLVPDILKFGEGAKSGAMSLPTFINHKIKLWKEDPQAKVIDWAVNRGFEWANENPSKAVEFVLHQAKKNPAYATGRMIGSGASGFALGGVLGAGARGATFAATKAARRARQRQLEYKGIGSIANMTMSHQSAAIETFNRLADQLKEYGTSLRQLPQETLAAIVHASGAGFDVNFDPETRAIRVEIETKDGSKKVPLDMQ